MCKHFCTQTQLSGWTEHAVWVPKCLHVLFSSKSRKIGIGFGNRPIADFFHDQTIFIKDCELYTIGHSLYYISQVNSITFILYVLFIKTKYFYGQKVGMSNNVHMPVLFWVLSKKYNLLWTIE